MERHGVASTTLFNLVGLGVEVKRFNYIILSPGSLLFFQQDTWSLRIIKKKETEDTGKSFFSFRIQGRCAAITFLFCTFLTFYSITCYFTD